ncbi:hypothetical protein ACFVIJ_18525, partial [Heyndrickxia sporothermodurans]
MTQTITGKDNLSKRILHEIEGGLRISEVPKLYPVSLDQAKRLSRFNNMLNKAKKQLNLEQYERLELLGLKSLPLSGLIKNSDWAGVIEVLSVITEDTTRKDINLLIKGLAAKRKRIEELKENVDLSLIELENTLKTLENQENELDNFKKKHGNKNTIDEIQSIKKEKIT